MCGKPWRENVLKQSMTKANDTEEIFSVKYDI